MGTASLNGGNLTPPLHIQADNAADNKNRYLLFVAAWLVLNKIVEEVEIGMLVVNHTHEDIDQFFSIPSKYMRGLFEQLVRDIKEFFQHCKVRGIMICCMPSLVRGVL